MKVTKLTPGSNMLWESSRMMLPEHKEAILQQNKERTKKSRPQLDEQELEELSYKLQLAFESKASVTIQLFDEYEDRNITGVVTKLDPISKRIKLTNGDDFEWVRLDEIVGIDDV